MPDGTVNLDYAKKRPYHYLIEWHVDLLKTWTELGYRLWVTRSDFTSLLSHFRNPNNLDLRKLNWFFRDPSVRDNLELLMDTDGYRMDHEQMQAQYFDIPHPEHNEMELEVARRRNANKSFRLTHPNTLCHNWESAIRSAPALRSDEIFD